MSGGDGVKKNIKSSGQPAMGRKRGSKKETKGALDGENGWREM